jgi:hypothetical protein
MIFLALNSLTLAYRAAHRDLMAGSNSFSISSIAAMCIAIGNVSLEEALILTWPLGCTGFLLPILAFMFDCVPKPVCQKTRGK